MGSSETKHNVYNLAASSSGTPTFDSLHRKVHLCFEENDYLGTTSNELRVFGTVYYAYRSNFLMAAFHAGLKMGECKDIWVHDVEYFQTFYASQFKDFKSTHLNGPLRAFVPTLSSTPPVSPTFPLTMQLVSTVAPNNLLDNVKGCGLFKEDSDISQAAMMMGLLQLSDGPSTDCVPPCGD